MEPSRTRFGPSALIVELNALSERIAAGESDEILDDFPKLIQQRFQLTDSQKEGLSALLADTENAPPLREIVNEAARSGGTSRFVVVHLPDKSRGGFVHELRRETVQDQEPSAMAGTPIQSLRIAHCDADCGNWGWG